MMNPPRISLITVCYNAEASIAGTLQSAREQTYRNFEHLIVDGASKDGTLEVVRQFSDLPLVISSEPDKGIYDAMNKGVARARGDILFFLNADDCLHDRDVLARVAQAFEAEPELDILWGDVINVFQDGEHTRTTHGHLTPQTLLYDSLCHQATFAHKRLFAQHGDFNTTYPICADFEWFLRVLHGGARYRHVGLDIALFARGGMHERDLGALYREKSRIRRDYLSPLHYYFHELRLNLRIKYYQILRQIKLMMCRSLPALGRCQRCQRLMRRATAEGAGGK